MLYWQQLINEVKDKKLDNDLEFPDKNIKRRKSRRYYLQNDVSHLYLTQREAECIFLILQGYTLKETATELSLSPRTIEFYFKRIKEKFGCNNRANLIKLLMQNLMMEKTLLELTVHLIS